jgi:hypothetical protein
MVPSLNGTPKRELPCAAACAREVVQLDRKIAARHVSRANCGSCARVSARARSAEGWTTAPTLREVTGTRAGRSASNQIVSASASECRISAWERGRRGKEGESVQWRA